MSRSSLMRFSTNVPMSKNSLKVMYTVVITSLRKGFRRKKRNIWFLRCPEEVTAIGLSAPSGRFALRRFTGKHNVLFCTMSPSPQVALRLFYYTPIVMNCQECLPFFPYTLPRFRLPAPLRGSTPRHCLILSLDS